MEFGKLSPLNVKCDDLTVELSDMENLTAYDISLLQLFFYTFESGFSKEEREHLEKLDLYLDVPLVQAVFDEHRSYDSYKRLVMNGCTIIPKVYLNNKSYLISAIEEDNFQIFSHAFSQHDYFVTFHAVVHNRMEIVKFLYAHDAESILHKEYTYQASKHRYLEMLTFLYEHGCCMHEMSLMVAVANGHEEVVKYIASLHLDHLERITPFVITSAIAHNQSNMLSLIPHEKNEPMYMIAAVRRGTVDSVRELRKQGFRWYTETVTAAAECGKLDIVKYLIEHGCPWSQEIIMVAAGYGHLDVVQYLHDIGCGYNKTLLLLTSINSYNMDLIKYISDEM
jgi:hypothetical protein